MDALEFLGILAAFAIVIVWYLRNEAAGADGALGLLALRGAPAAQKKRAYRIKPRTARPRRRRQTDDPVPVKAAYRSREEGERMRRRFRRQDAARYRVKDKAARQHSKKGPGGACT